VTPSSSNGLSWDDGSQDTLRRLVAAANKSGHGTKIVLSVGGWGGCQYFHQAMSSSANRGVFIAALAAAVSQYGLAGVDIDWVRGFALSQTHPLTSVQEYPNDPGAGQPYGSADSANFLTFLTYLRKSLGSSAIISGTAPDTVWKGSNGNPLTSGLAAYAAQMTYVNIM
jgi:chitinase